MNGHWKRGPVSLVLALAASFALPFSRPVLAEEVSRADIFGHVVLGDGTGLSGVALTLGDSDRVYARTDERGAYRIPALLLKTYVIRARKPGYIFSPESRSVTLPTTGKPTSPAAEANFKASQLKTLAITGLIRTPNKKPLPNVAVTLTGEGFTARTAKTNANGVYEFGKLPYGKYTVTPKLEGYSFNPEKRNLTIPTGDGEFAPNGRANFLANPTVVAVQANIYGYIKTTAGAGVAGIGIYLGDGTTAVATTNAEGRYTIVNPGKGRYVVTPRESGATFDPVSRVVELPTQNQDSSPHAVANFIYKEVKPDSYDIRGRVTGVGGVGVSGVGIYLGDGTVAVATTNAEGRYAIEELPAGRYVVRARKEGSTFLPASRVVELPTSGATTSPDGVANFELQVTTKYDIRGRVTGSGGVGVAGVGIFIGDSTTASATTNNEGRYAIEELVVGRYVLKAGKEGSTFAPATRVVELPTTGTETSPDGVANFETQVAINKYTIRGKVTGGTGVALANVSIRIGDTVRATTNAEGRYAIEGLGAGTYIVTPIRERFTFTPANKTITLPTTEGSTLPNAEVNFSGQERTGTATTGSAKSG